MGRAPSMDLQSHVLKAVDEGMSLRGSCCTVWGRVTDAIRWIARAGIGGVDAPATGLATRFSPR